MTNPDHVPLADAGGDRTRTFPVRWMAVDAGSNALKYRVWEIRSDGATELIREERIAVRIGREVFTQARLAEETLRRAVEAFDTIEREGRSLGVAEIRAVGTSALRLAANGGELARRVTEKTGIRLEIISELEEARLVALGAAFGLKSLAYPHWVVDVGGGSTEVIWVESRERVEPWNLPLGAVRLKETCFPELPPEEMQVERAMSHVREIIGRVMGDGGRDAGGLCLGSGGTCAVAMALVGGRRETGEIERRTLSEWIPTLKRLSADEITKRFVTPPDRADILLAGALILEAILERLGVERLRPVRGGVSAGMLVDFLERARPG